MSRLRLTFEQFQLQSRVALIAVIVLFALSQIIVAAHTAKYGDGPHQHDGQACVLSLAAHSGAKAIVASAFVFAVAMTVWRSADQVTQSERALVAIRAARPRGPPSL